jgi:hypothetical protein
MNKLGVAGLSAGRIEAIVSFPGYGRAAFDGVHGFSPNGIAIAPNGTIYLDTFWGNGYSDKSAIATISPNRHSALLWDRIRRRTADTPVLPLHPFERPAR